MSTLLTRLPHLVATFTLASALFIGTTRAETTLPARSVVLSGTAEVIASTSALPQELHSEFVPLSLLNESLWQRLRSSFEFADIDNKRVDKQIEFLQAGLISLRSNLKDAGPYLYYITEQLKRAGVPLDIAMLPLIESAFNPTARSTESAVGIWQFIPATASYYGLSVEQNYDQRKDVMASTTAAVRYLTDLHRMFDGDWMLALAAYNTGPGNVRSAMRRAIKHGKEPTYWNLKLSKETSNYVPRLIAATKLINNPEQYGLDLPPLANRKQIESVSVGRRISLQQVAELTNLSAEEVTHLNPGLHKGLTPVNGPHRLILPVGTTPQLLEGLKNLKRQPLVNKKSHATVVTRDVSDPFVIDSEVSSAIRLPATQRYSAYQSYHYKTHTVKNGDSLWKVSRKLGVDIDTLRAWNDLETGKPIQAGDKLRVAYLATETPVPTNTRLMHYRVNPTESLAKIATKFDLHIGEIKKWNGSLLHENHVQPGQVLRIPYLSANTESYGP